MTKLIIIGSGGHAKVLLHVLAQCASHDIIGMLDANPKLYEQNVLGVPVLGNDDVIANYDPHEVQLVNGIGSTDIPIKRRSIFKKFKLMGFHFASVIHPKSIIGEAVQLGEGVQIMAGSVIQPGCRIGANTLINTSATVEHECVVGDHVHLAPGTTVSGDCVIGNSSHIGTGAVIIQGIKIAEECLIAAGAVVVADVKEKMRMAGVPAKRIGNIKEDVLSEKLE